MKIDIEIDIKKVVGYGTILMLVTKAILEGIVDSAKES